MNTESHQKRAYALNRMSRAVDRVIAAKSESAKAKAALWVAAWWRVA